MDLTSGVAQMAMQMKSMDARQSYSVAVQEKVMDQMETAGQEFQELMPESVAQIPKGEYIDVYA